MSKKDLYDVLGLGSDCHPKDIKKNYRHLALKWHPDKHTNAKESASKFHEIHEAYSVLINSDKRRIYDNYGHAGLQGLGSNDESVHTKNTYLQKGFQGTDKSAFEFLWDILQERDDESFSDAYQNFEMPTDFKSRLSNFINDKSPTEKKDQSNNLFNSYIPTFADPEFISQQDIFNQRPETPSYTNQSIFNQTEAKKAGNSDLYEELRQSRRSTASQSCSSSNSSSPSAPKDFSFNNYNGSNFTFNAPNSQVIIIDDNEDNDTLFYQTQPNFSMSNQLNQFQEFLDTFHDNLIDSLHSHGNLNSSSKKIAKREKILSSPSLNKKEQARRCSPTSVSMN